MASRKSPEYAFEGGLTLREIVEEPKLVLPQGLDLTQFTREERLFIYAALEQSLQIEEDTLRSLEIPIDGKQTYIIFDLSDLHFGSSATDLAVLFALQRIILMLPNARVILLGDDVDGRGKYPTNDARNISIKRQVELFRMWLRPIRDAGKVLCAVGEYNGHNGWVVDTNVVGWNFIFEDEMDVPILGNGETVEFVERDTENPEVLYTLSVAHNPGRKSQDDPVHGLRILRRRKKTRGAVAGHTHQFGIEQETFWDSDGEVMKTTLVNSGAFKGSSKNKDVPKDAYGVRLTLPEVAMGGSGFLLSPRLVSPSRLKHHTIEGYPYATPRDGILLQSALTLLDSAEAQQITSELIEQIRSQNPKKRLQKEESLKYKVRFITSQSRTGVGQTPAESEQWHRRQEKSLADIEKLRQKTSKSDGVELSGEALEGPKSEWFHDPYAPVYQRLVVRFDPDKLPFAIHFHSNLGLGASSFDQKSFESRLAELTNPWDLNLWLRGIIDKDLGLLNNRRDYLDKVVSWMEQTAGSNLAMMIAGEHRMAPWKGMARGFSVSGNVSQEEMLKYGPIAPATYISKKSGIPLIANQGVIEMRVGNNMSWSQFDQGVMDKLKSSGSISKATLGLIKAYATFPQPPSSIAGGHMPGSGFSMIFDPTNPTTDFPTQIAPGWDREVDTIGKGNVIFGGPSGYSNIIVPINGQLVQYPIQGIYEGRTILNAMTLQLGEMLYPKLFHSLRANG